MKNDNKCLDFTNQNIRNKPLPILFYMLDCKKKLSPLDYQTYKLQTNLKGKKLAVYNLVVKYCKVGTPRSGDSSWKPSCRTSRVRTSRMEMQHTCW
eukprot:12286645-Ditylum_brightwellii.AAC.1